MADPAASPLGDLNFGSIGESLSSNNESGSDGSQAEEGGPHSRQISPSIHSLDFILDIPLKITVELGRTKMTIRDILQLAQGSVIELSKFAGEPLEVLVNDKLIARGEVVVVNEKFGIRLTDIISPIERIEQLK